MRFLLLLLAASALPVAGCGPFGGCDAGTSNYDSSAVTLAAPLASAARLLDCSRGPGAFTGGFTLTIDSDSGSFLVSVEGSATIGQAIPLHVELSTDAAAPQGATADDRTIRLAYDPGQTPVDDSGLASALVTVVSVPTDGAPATLSLDLDLRFVDGRELLQSFSAPVEGVSACPVD